MQNKQTAVEWLMDKLPTIDKYDPYYEDIIQQAKAMEKQQHGQTWDAAIKAHDNRGHVHSRSITDFDEYYNETYKQ